MKKNLEKFIGSKNGAFTDVTFELDDGKMKSHRAMLIARCDMMRAMLNGDFREAHAHTVCTSIEQYHKSLLRSFLTTFIFSLRLNFRSFCLALRSIHSTSSYAICIPMKYLKYRPINV